MTWAVVAPMPGSASNVPVAFRRSTSPGASSASTAAARRNARTRYVGSPPRSSSNAICRNACTGSTGDLYPGRSAGIRGGSGRIEPDRTHPEGGAMFHVDSEVGRLRQVILHRPDLELKRLTPDNAADLLFDDVLWVSRAQAEHDAFADVLRSRGVVVHYYGDLLAQTLDTAAARDYILDRVFDSRWHGPLAAELLRAAVGGLD